MKSSLKRDVPNIRRYYNKICLLVVGITVFCDVFTLETLGLILYKIPWRWFREIILSYVDEKLLQI